MYIRIAKHPCMLIHLPQCSGLTNQPLPFTLPMAMGEERFPGARDWEIEAPREVVYPPLRDLFPGARDKSGWYTQHAACGARVFPSLAV